MLEKCENGEEHFFVNVVLYLMHAEVCQEICFIHICVCKEMSTIKKKRKKENDDIMIQWNPFCCSSYIHYKVHQQMLNFLLQYDTYTPHHMHTHYIIKNYNEMDDKLFL